MSSLWLKEHRKNITSQNGEDGVLEVIFQRIGITNKWCCEIGAADGVTFSNTHQLLRKGWKCILIEHNWEQYQLLGKNLAADIEAKLAVPVLRHITKGGPDTLDQTLTDCFAPPWLDLLSIDTDGLDLEIWESLSDDHRPRVVIIEVNSCIPPGIITEATSLGPCVESVVALGKRKGYELALHLGNCIFVSSEYAPDLGIEPKKWPELFDRSWLHEPSKAV